jgi:hypothetical protein
MQRLEVSGAVRHIYVIRRLKVKQCHKYVRLQCLQRMDRSLEHWYNESCCQDKVLGESPLTLLMNLHLLL